MAITINLLQGKLRADMEKKLDPMKIGMLALLIIGAGVAMYISLKQAEVSGIKSDVRRLQAENDKLKPELERLKALRLVDEPRLATIDALTNRLNKRFFWAPTLEGIMKATPNSVQLNKFSGNIDPKGQVTIDLDCFAASDNPRQAAEDLRTALIAHFRKEDPAADANFPSMVDSALPLEVDGQKVPTVQFTLNLKYTSAFGVTAAPETTAPPPPAPSGGGGGGDGGP